MRKLIVFDHVSLDGCFVDGAGEMRWAHKDDSEWNAFASENAAGGGTLLFGRVTYELMASFWPTPQAMQTMPAVAERMNHLPKIVFSRTLKEATWSNTRLVKGDLAAEVRRMKQEPGEGMSILGSGSIVSQLTQAGLIDEYQVVVNPVVLGQGRTLFEGVKDKVALTRVRTRVFGNGNVLLCYEPAAVDREIVSTRVFDVPRERLFAAWADPQRLARWWGPKGFTNTFEEFELRTGGMWRFAMHGPDGKDYANYSVFVEVVEPERIVYDHISPPQFRMTATIDDLGDRTRLTWRMRFETAAQCEKMKALCVPANEQNFDRLEAELRRAR